MRLRAGTKSHTLQLVFGDYLRIPHEKPIFSAKITITVK